MPSLKLRLVSFGLFAIGAVAGCDTGITPPSDDLSASVDIAMKGPDLAKTPIVDLAFDASVPPDLSVTPPDLFAPDMTNLGPAPTVIPHPDWFTFCQSFTACGLFASTTSLSGCLRIQPVPGALPFAPRGILACLANAGADCAKAKICLNNGNANYSCLGDAGAQASCGNDVYTVCQKGDFKFAIDCNRQGFSCVGVPDPMMPNSNYSGCGFGTCVTDGGATGTKYCVSGFAANCNAGGRLAASEDCRVFDTEACEVNDAGTAACIGTGNACAKSSCAGTTMVSCKSGREARFDCANMGLVCVDAGNNSVKCGLGTQCDPAAYVETCNGNQLTYCDLGQVKTVDCVQAGWKRCVPRSTPDGGSATGGFCSAF